MANSHNDHISNISMEFLIHLESGKHQNFKQGFVELYTQRLKEKNINTKNLRTPKAETP